MILLDTMVVSELRKTKPNPGVLSYLTAQNPQTTYLSAITIGEIEAGTERQRSRDPAFAEDLAQWLASTELRFAQNILPVSAAVAKLWGRLSVHTGNKGIDNLIAATALHHNLSIVTRNVRHFAPTGARIVNPFR